MVETLRTNEVNFALNYLNVNFIKIKNKLLILLLNIAAEDDNVGGQVSSDQRVSALMDSQCGSS